MQKKKLSQSGITLIALIITIIVMLILVAVTVNLAVNSGLFGHAKNATQGWKAEEEKESNIGNDNYIKDTVNQYTGEQNSDPMTTDRSFLKVGDYIDYTPDTAENYIGLGTSASEKSGSASNPVAGIPQDTTLKWRVMNINDDGSVDIVSASPIVKSIYFCGSIGYNNYVFLLNDLCKSLYSNSTLEVTARSIDLEDIEPKLNSIGIAARNAYTAYGGLQYGNVKTTQPNYFDDPSFYELIFGTGEYYLLASRSVTCYTDIAYFCLRYVNNSTLAGDRLFFSNNNAYNTGFYVRPVVSLGSNIKISTDGGTADSPRALSK